MKNIYFKPTIFSLILFFTAVLILFNCKKVEELNQDPELESLKHGFKVSAAVGYCASLVNALFRGEDLPDNVIFQSSINDDYSGSGIMYVTINSNYPLPFNSSIGQIIIPCLWNVIFQSSINDDYSGSGIMYVTINSNYPLPFNSNIGQIIIPCLWNVSYDGTEYSGVITTIFTDIDILEGKYEFRGIHTIPVIETEAGNILTLFAEQDIIIGEGSDTLLNLSLSNPQFNLELARLETQQPNDVFVAAKQNAWFITADQNNTMSDIYDDEFTINGGGQIAQVLSESGGIIYHALIGAEFTHNICNLNPVRGVGFIQNMQVGTEIDLGSILLNFHDLCDGKAFVELATGKYVASNRRNVNLNFY